MTRGRVIGKPVRLTALSQRRGNGASLIMLSLPLCRVRWLAVILVVCALSAKADMVSINFEDLPDAYFFSAGGQNIGTFYSGVTFGPYVTGLSVSRFGGYGDAAYPPHSGDVVVWSAFDNTAL